MNVAIQFIPGFNEVLSLHRRGSWRRKGMCLFNVGMSPSSHRFQDFFPIWWFLTHNTSVTRELVADQCSQARKGVSLPDILFIGIKSGHSLHYGLLGNHRVTVSHSSVNLFLARVALWLPDLFLEMNVAIQFIPGKFGARVGEKACGSSISRCLYHLTRFQGFLLFGVSSPKILRRQVK